MQLELQCNVSDTVSASIIKVDVMAVTPHLAREDCTESSHRRSHTNISEHVDL
jgi:hypothetical protein